ncbi:MAG: AMP-binding protein [Negativicutes bacterium]|nr:AMP-binding protein [Negativicutes bacterium]
MGTVTSRKTPLEAWIAGRIGCDMAGVTREKIDCYQLQRLQETIRLAYHGSPFYRRLWNGCVEPELACPADLRRFPFTTAEDIRRQGLQFLCVSQGDISRVVTLATSGTTGAAKRLYFTPADQERTIDFFQYGMAAFTEAGDRVLILLPGERTGSVGNLLAIALTRLGAVPVPHGVVRSLPDALAVLTAQKIDSLVGIPSQVLALARYAEVAKKAFHLKNVLLSTDHVPRAIVSELKKAWDCDVFEHYGMTEMGLGGGTDCAAHSGYHLHEADFYFEIVDPLTGEVLPPGQEGEVVITTLTRQGMPLIRYRTGDISRLLVEPCGCGSILKRLAPITERIDGRISLNGNRYFTLADLDEVLFAVDGVINYTAAVDNIRKTTKLTIAVWTVGRPDNCVEYEIYKALDAVPAIGLARQAGMLTAVVKPACCEGLLAPSTAKRVITELNEADGK